MLGQLDSFGFLTHSHVIEGIQAKFGGLGLCRSRSHRLTISPEVLAAFRRRLAPSFEWDGAAHLWKRRRVVISKKETAPSNRF
jgi:hypothetical protein